MILLIISVFFKDNKYILFTGLQMCDQFQQTFKCLSVVEGKCMSMEPG